MSMDKVEVVTVGQMKSLLDDYDDDLPIGFGYPIGDYWRSTGVVLPNIAEEKHVKWSPNQRTVVVDESEDPSSDVWLIVED